MSAAQQERAAVVETMRSVGPDAPTLCEGWTTRDLAAHLVIRERRPSHDVAALSVIEIRLVAGCWGIWHCRSSFADQLAALYT